MSDLCPYAHQLCADRHLCQMTPSMVLGLLERAKGLIMARLPRQPDSAAPPTRKAMEAAAESTRLERLDWVAAQTTDCPQALPMLTPEEREARAKQSQVGLPL